MGGMSFGNLPGNNAPMPVFGGTNPTGMIPGGFNNKNSFGFPSYNMFGASNPFGAPGYVTPEANLGLWPTSSSGGGGGGIQTLSSGFGVSSPYDPNLGKDISKQLGNDYGAGIGNLITDILTNGLFNPQVAQAYINAMQPAYNRGMASIGQEFSAEGARFGSSAALGFGDYSSQFALNEQQVMAEMYMQAQQEQLSLLENILPTVHAEQADSQAGWLSTLSDVLSFGALGQGAATILQNAKGAGNVNASTPNVGLPSGGMMAGTPTPSSSPFSMDTLQLLMGSESGGAALGGASSTGDLSSLLMLGGLGA